jgi:hypothetical protein
MRRALKWVLAGLAIILVSLAVFIFAAWLVPGAPGRFYQIAGIVLLSATLLWRLAGGPMR